MSFSPRRMSRFRQRLLMRLRDSDVVSMQAKAPWTVVSGNDGQRAQRMCFVWLELWRISIGRTTALLPNLTLLRSDLFKWLPIYGSIIFGHTRGLLCGRSDL